MGAGLIAPAAPGAPVDLAFLDRDGTINVRRDGYVADPEDLVLVPGAAAAVARLNASGARVVVVTNQRGLSDDRLTWTQWHAVMARLDRLLAVHGAHIDHVELCPHAEGTCSCRKPAPGLFVRALARAPWADPSRCVMVGDMPSDVAPARALGIPAWQVGEDVDSLAAAVDLILADVPRRGHGP